MLAEGGPVSIGGALQDGHLGVDTFCRHQRPDQFIVTGDRHLLEMSPFQGIPIVEPAGFLALRDR